METLFLESKKELCIPVELSLLRDWTKILEETQRGTVLTYLQLQASIITDRNNLNYGKAEISTADLCSLSAITYPTLRIILRALEEHKFISREESKPGFANKYIILPFPEYKKDIVQKSLDVDIKGVEPFSEGLDGNKDNCEKEYREYIEKLNLKDSNLWTGQDIFDYFRLQYFLIRKIRFRTKRNPMDNTICKQLREQYSTEAVKKMIVWSLTNWDNLPYVKEPPTIITLSRYKDYLMPDTIKNNKYGKVKSGEQEDKKLGEW